MKPIGVIGGTGFERFAIESAPVTMLTEYGDVHVYPMIIGGRDVRFISRHGMGENQTPPQYVNYAGNMVALKNAGCDNVLVTTAVGDLISPENVGRLAVPDQLINYTEGRLRTLYKNRIVHVEFGDPYCNRLRRMIFRKGEEMGLGMKDRGTVAVVGGNHFSARAEHSRFKRDGCTLVGMTQYPEAVFARELEMCYAAVAIITDYAVNYQDPQSARETTHADVAEVFKANIGKVTRLLEELVPQIPDARGCPCSTALSRAVHG